MKHFSVPFFKCGHCLRAHNTAYSSLYEICVSASDPITGADSTRLLVLLTSIAPSPVLEASVNITCGIIKDGGHRGRVELGISVVSSVDERHAMISGVMTTSWFVIDVLRMGASLAMG